MKIIKKAPGTTIDFASEGPIAIFDGKLRVDTGAYVGPDPVHLFICADALGHLRVGGGEVYVAELDIPAIRRELIVGEADDKGFPLLSESLYMPESESITVTLWPWEVSYGKI